MRISKLEVVAFCCGMMVGCSVGRLATTTATRAPDWVIDLEARMVKEAKESEERAAKWRKPALQPTASSEIEEFDIDEE